MSCSVRRLPLRSAEPASGPPLTPEELTTNLSLLERMLNHEMKCPVGKNQVYIRSLINGHGATRPRIALKCPLRRDIGQSPDVYFEHIRDVCCTDHEHCEAWKAFAARHVPT